MLHPKTVVRFWTQVAIKSDDECWLWQALPDRQGYGRFKAEGKEQRANRVAYRLHFGDFAQELMVRHKCDTPGCCNPFHLVLGTQANNIDDRTERGRGPVGVRNGRAKLTPDQARAIRDSELPGTEVARQFGVDKSTVYAIRRGDLWGG